ncbi:GNAT family N-acetyltransferase [Staphylococcus massiliensis]|uniref:Acetyltransferase n=1 Tax=Staphylococcus massiliensis S46 TaxID=1229783 RepID=K9AZ67_9STAP|nr:GNAT family protein [Staphylococcus massiliensis]EKU46805.1 acetyltransferase [Staphylococcus massiliensis S46]MCG3399280.1 GNAT family N-acetyltransferase [Staphylococcus massiliensis]MCG3402351.1 GNAT family N-acetyltransferase [Staphylococcus massiliensis]MCG3411682.1 GNAT family N-acetyltransferase [Staphylococcus massiliensis]POA01371.1 N-acetyltransferase [Staphylococcus massiliensis CCUG 55927]
MTIQDGISLSEIGFDEMKALYYWKYEEPLQAAKKWNGPYIKEPLMTFHTYIKSFEKSRYIEGNVRSAFAIKHLDRVIGMVGCHYEDTSSKWLEIGIVIYDPDYWEQGIGRYVFKLWIDYLFENTSAHRISISTWSGNTRMMKLAERCGMVLEGRLREARLVNGLYYDSIKMGILRKEWSAMKGL